MTVELEDEKVASPERTTYYIMRNGELVETTRHEFEAVIFDVKYYGQKKGTKE